MALDLENKNIMAFHRVIDALTIEAMKASPGWFLPHATSVLERVDPAGKAALALLFVRFAALLLQSAPENAETEIMTSKAILTIARAADRDTVNINDEDVEKKIGDACSDPNNLARAMKAILSEITPREIAAADIGEFEGLSPISAFMLAALAIKESAMHGDVSAYELSEIQQSRRRQAALMMEAAAAVFMGYERFL